MADRRARVVRLRSPWRPAAGRLLEAGVGLDSQSNVLNVGGTYSTVGASTGNFTFSTSIPLEFAKAYGVISSANASLLPNIFAVNVNTGAGICGTSGPATLPTMAFHVDQDFYWLPEEHQHRPPPGLGTTEQWVYQPAEHRIVGHAECAAAPPRRVLVHDHRGAA